MGHTTMLEATTESPAVKAADSALSTQHSALAKPSALSQEPLLLFEHVSKWYGAVLALNQVTLELTGGITGLVGANGAGKSTLLRLATGQLRPPPRRVP